MIKILETKLANKLAHLATKKELIIEDEKEMYIENGNNYRDFVDIRFDKHFDYYFNIIWDLKED